MELKDLQGTAALARLNMRDEELEKILPAFNEMLSFFAQMQEGCNGAANAGAANAASATGTESAAPEITVTADRLRPDTAPAGETLSEVMLAQAPECDGRFIVIPNVL